MENHVSFQQFCVDHPRGQEYWPLFNLYFSGIHVRDLKGEEEGGGSCVVFLICKILLNWSWLFSAMTFISPPFP